jgi:hypothetical protein
MSGETDDHRTFPDANEVGPRVSDLLDRLERDAREEAGDDIAGEGHQVIHGLVRWNDDLDLDLETTAALLADSPQLLRLLCDTHPEDDEEAVTLHAAADYALKQWLTEQLEARLGLDDTSDEAD